MYGLIIGIILFVCVLLVLIVLVQNPKGGGLASGFSSSNQFMGVKRTADFIEKATWGFAAGLFVLSVVATMIPRDGTAQQQSKIQQQIEDNTAIDPQRLPSYPGVPTEQSSEGQEQPEEQTQQQQ